MTGDGGFREPVVVGKVKEVRMKHVSPITDISSSTTNR